MFSMDHLLRCKYWLCPPLSLPACKRKEQEPNKDRNNSQKKSRLVFTDLQRRTLFAIFKENKRPSKEMQITISQQLGLELTTVSNFFMNARRRSLEKWQDDLSTAGSSSTSSTCTKAWWEDSQLGTSHLQWGQPIPKENTKEKDTGFLAGALHWWFESTILLKRNFYSSCNHRPGVLVLFCFVFNGYGVQVQAENESLWTGHCPLSTLSIP